MPSAYALPDLFRALRDGDGPWYRRTFSAMMRYLGRTPSGLTPSAMPERDVPGWVLNLSFNSLKIKYLLTVVRNSLQLKYYRTPSTPRTGVLGVR